MRLSTWIPSVWMEASLLDVVDEMLTWQPKCLKLGGKRGSRGVVGLLVGGCMLMLGIGGGSGGNTGVAGSSVWVKDVTISGGTTSGGGVFGGLIGSSMV